MKRWLANRPVCVLTVLLSVLALPHTARGQGIYAPGIGAVNRSMGSAAVAAPLDGMGAINWNPASLCGLERSELSCSIEFLLPDIDVASSVPGIGAGVTGSESGVTPLPNMAWVHRTPIPQLAIGFGILSVAGFQTNYRASLTNPVLAPQRSAATFPLGGFGRVHSEGAFIDLAPTVAYAVNDQLALGFSPVATMAKLEVGPMVLAGLNDADGDFVSTYPLGQGSRYSWGGGANLGLYYIRDSSWRFGVSVKTPRWIEDFRFHTQDNVGNPSVARFDCDLPMVVSLGTSYAGIENLLFALDLRYIDYDNARGFGDSGLNPDGSLNGLGWNSIFAAAAGLQCRVTEWTFARLGYVFNQNPIPDSQAQFNIASPLFYQHTISGGLSYQPFECLAINLSYAYSPEARISGPITLAPNAPTGTPPVPVPGSSITNTLSVHAIDLGVTVRY